MLWMPGSPRRGCLECFGAREIQELHGFSPTAIDTSEYSNNWNTSTGVHQLNSDLQGKCCHPSFTDEGAKSPQGLRRFP